jgi:hypothetical protein
VAQPLGIPEVKVVAATEAEGIAQVIHVTVEELLRGCLAILV